MEVILERWVHDRAADERFDLGHMEGGVNTAKGTREVEADCGGADDSGYEEGSD